ncbi:MAG: hypothetical protein ACFFCS_00485, partial [Candidatus Hodarchaeota archaeon]
MISDTKNNPVIFHLEPGDFTVSRPDDPELSGLDEVYMREGGNLLVASTIQDDLVNYINNNVEQGNPVADHAIYQAFKDWKQYTFNCFNQEVQSLVADVNLSPMQRMKEIARVNAFMNFIQGVLGRIKPARLISKFLVAVLSERVERGKGMQHLRDLPDLNGHELGLVLKLCANDNGVSLGNSFLLQLGGFLKASCKKLWKERPLEIRAVKKYFLDIIDAESEMLEGTLLHKLCSNSFFTGNNPLFDERVKPIIINHEELEDLASHLEQWCLDLSFWTGELMDINSCDSLGKMLDEDLLAIVKDCREMLNAYNCIVMATEERNELGVVSMLYYIDHEFIGNEKLSEIKELCINEPVILISKLGKSSSSISVMDKSNKYSIIVSERNGNLLSVKINKNIGFISEKNNQNQFTICPTMHHSEKMHKIAILGGKSVNIQSEIKNQMLDDPLYFGFSYTIQKFLNDNPEFNHHQILGLNGEKLRKEGKYLPVGAIKLSWLKYSKQTGETIEAGETTMNALGEKVTLENEKPYKCPFLGCTRGFVKLKGQSSLLQHLGYRYTILKQYHTKGPHVFWDVDTFYERSEMYKFKIYNDQLNTDLTDFEEFFHYSETGESLLEKLHKFFIISAQFFENFSLDFYEDPSVLANLNDGIFRTFWQGASGEGLTFIELVEKSREYNHLDLLDWALYLLGDLERKFKNYEAMKEALEESVEVLRKQEIKDDF